MSKKNLKKFGLKVKKYRLMNGYTQAKLAEKLKMSANFIGMIERGERNPSLDKIYMIAKALEISPEKLFENN